MSTAAEKIELELYNPATVPPAGAPCEWCRGPNATELVAVTPPKIGRGGVVREQGTKIRVCSTCGEQLDHALEQRRQAEERERQRKAEARRAAKPTRRR